MRPRLKRERTQRHWTQSYTAEQLGVTERAYRHFEAGTRTPRYETIVQLEALFGVPYKELLVQDDTPQRKVQ